MGLTRTDLYEKQELELARVAKALAHPARISIIQCLLATESCITGDLTEQIGLAQPTISQHLRELKEAGIIQGTITGTSVNYCINPIRWQEISANFQHFFARFPNNNNCC